MPYEFLMLFIDVNKWKIHNQGLNWEIISSNNSHCREAFLIILSSTVLSNFTLCYVGCTFSCNKSSQIVWTLKIQAQIHEIYLSIAPQQRRFPVNGCWLDYLVSLHKNLMLTNDAVLSRWFIYGRCTVPIVGTAQWLDGLTHLRHLASWLSHSFCHCLPEATQSVFNNIPITCLDLCWTCL